MPTLKPQKRPEGLQTRKCRYCRSVFEIRKSGGSKQDFCKPEHRKLFHAHGSLSMGRLQDRLQRMTDQELKLIKERLAAIEASLEEVRDLKKWISDLSAKVDRLTR